MWLPLHGYDFDSTPLWAGIFMLLLTGGFLLAGPTAGFLLDRIGSRELAMAGAVLFGVTFVGLALMPIDFSYWLLAALLALNGIASGMFGSPNISSIMGSVPAERRGVASGVRATFQNLGTALSIGVFSSLMIAGLARSRPHTLATGLLRPGVPQDPAVDMSNLPPASSFLAAQLGVNPVEHLLASNGVLAALSPAGRAHGA